MKKALYTHAIANLNYSQVKEFVIRNDSHGLKSLAFKLTYINMGTESFNASSAADAIEIEAI